MGMYFTGNNDGPSIEEYIKYYKKTFLSSWKFAIWANLRGNALLWRNSIDLCPKELEQLFLDK